MCEILKPDTELVRADLNRHRQFPVTEDSEKLEIQGW